MLYVERLNWQKSKFNHLGMQRCPFLHLFYACIQVDLQTKPSHHHPYILTECWCSWTYPFIFLNVLTHCQTRTGCQPDKHFHSYVHSSGRTEQRQTSWSDTGSEMGQAGRPLAQTQALLCEAKMVIGIPFKDPASSGERISKLTRSLELIHYSEMDYL